MFEDIYDVRQSFEKGETVVVRNIEQWQSVLKLVSKVNEDVMSINYDLSSISIYSAKINIGTNGLKIS